MSWRKTWAHDEVHETHELWIWEEEELSYGRTHVVSTGAEAPSLLIGVDGSPLTPTKPTPVRRIGFASRR